MSEELKPCPYCGGNSGIRREPKYDTPIQKQNGFEMLEAFSVHCDKCEMRSSVAIGANKAIAAWNALPRRLKFTKEKPTKPDYYWNKDGKMLRIGEIMELSGSLFCHFAGENEPQLLDLIDGEWAGPIPEPMGAEQ